MSDAPAGTLRSGLLLAVVAVGGVSLLAAVHLLTRERIAEQERRVVIEQLAQVLPARQFDNDLLDDQVRIRDPARPDDVALTPVYRATLGGNPAALIMRVTAPDGYNGDIALLVGIKANGVLSGVRVVSHRETPGLGDPIESRRSDWITGFTGRSLGQPPVDRWKVKRDGGDFDQFTGATITPRAVVRAVRRALEYYQQHGDAIFELESGDTLDMSDETNA